MVRQRIGNVHSRRSTRRGWKRILIGGVVAGAARAAITWIFDQFGR